LKHLTKLLLGRCENLKELPQTIGSISSLSILNLSYCKSIESLRIIIGDLKHLTELLLEQCRNFKELLRTIGNMSSLLILDLSYCKSIESLPTTIVDLKHFTKLKLGGCENLKEVPQTIRNMSSLSILDLSYSERKKQIFLIQKSIESLPTTIVDLKHLIVLLLQGCQILRRLF
jgi:Leucine-rich repeat (LRR) protein